MVPPKPLYKYCSAKVGIENILEQGIIKWSRADELNDPFDIHIDPKLEDINDTVIDNFLENFLNIKEFPISRDFRIGERIISTADFVDYIKKMQNSWTPEYLTDLRNIALETIKSFKNNWPKHLADMRAEFERTAVFCMSEKFDIVRMWSLYAESHKGLVIAFSPNDALSPFSLAQPAQYISEIPKIKYTDYVTLPEPKAIERLTQWYTLSKHKSWEYEQEWRVVVSEGNGIKPFHKEDVDAVYLGCKMTTENKNKVATILRYKYPKANLYVASLGDEFKLDFVEFNNQ